jgi:uncharacterized repeat protein (TIGR01451 family)
MATALSDENPAGESASDDTDVTPEADLAVTVSDGQALVTAGDGLTHGYLITVTNFGPSDATSVTLADEWPSGFVRGAVIPSQGTCSPVAGGPDFTCDLGTIASEWSASVTVDYRVPVTAASGPQTYAVTVTTATVDPDAANDSAVDTTTVVDIPATDALATRPSLPGGLGWLILFLFWASVAGSFLALRGDGQD